MKFLPALVFLLLAVTGVQAALITSASREFPTVYSVAQGSWHYEARFSNNSIYPMAYLSPNSIWVHSTACGTGIVTNKSTTFLAEPNVTLSVSPGIIDAGCSRIHPYNSTVNWTSNFTGNILVSGWYKRQAITADNYNLTFWKNKDMVWGVEKTDDTNYTYSTQLSIAVGDNITFVVAPKTYNEQPFVNLTVFIEENSNIELDVATPPNNTANMTLVIPFGFTPKIINYSISQIYTNATVYANLSGWSIIGQNTTLILNNTLTWINATFPKHGQFKFAVEVCVSTGKCNLTNNYTLNLTPPRLIVQAYDTISLGRVYYTAQVANTTNSTSYGIVYWLNKSFMEIPTGTVTFTAGNTSYFPVVQTVSLDLNASNDSAIALYFMPTSNYSIHAVQFVVINNVGVGLAGATVTVKQLIGTTYVTIGSVTTDSAGQAGFYLDGSTNYQVTATKSGYVAGSWDIIPIGSQYFLPLGTVSGGGYDSPFNDTTIEITPWVFLNYPLFSVNATINSTNLIYYGINITLANTTQLYFVNVSSSTTGGQMYSGHINRTDWNGTLYARVFFLKSGYSETEYLRIYYFSNFTDSNSSLTAIIANFKAANLSSSFKLAIALFGSLIFATGVGALASFGFSGIGVSFILAFSFFSYTLGFVENQLYYLFALLAIAIYIIKSGFH